MSLRLVHISDLHFDAAAGQTSTHRHSDEHLSEIAVLLSTENFERLIVSGDVTNAGDRDSLRLARDYLLASIQSPSGPIGLGLGTMERVIVVPGNHDAFNSTGMSAPYASIWAAWQRSTENFGDVFPEKPLPKPYGCNYDWIESETDAVFICYVNSCYLGDTNAPNIFQFFRHVARGDVSLQQTDEIRNLYYRGQRGTLPKPNSSELITKERFAGALKVLVMHHYLVPPPGVRFGPLMRIRQQRDVFMRLALCDFDVVLCGHSHIAHHHEREYSDHFDRRNRKRFQRAYASRVFGTENFPRVLGARHERYALSNWSSFTLNCFVKQGLIQGETQEDLLVEQTSSAMKAALATDSAFKKSMRSAFASIIDTGELEIDREQLRRIHRAVLTTLTQAERIQLARLSRKLPELLRATRHRSFVQMSCGSSAKAVSKKSPTRSVYMYEVLRNGNYWELTRKEFLWDNVARRFMANAPPAKPTTFGRARRPV